jgi:hypothetical protein
MRHARLKPRQREWIAQLQRQEKHLYSKHIHCDIETGIVYRIDEDNGEHYTLGWLPKKAIPYRRKRLQELEDDRKKMEELIVTR